MLSSGILLADQTLQENTRQKVKAIERASRTQAQLIEDLLDVSRIESGRMRLDVQATDLAQVVKPPAGVAPDRGLKIALDKPYRKKPRAPH